MQRRKGSSKGVKAATIGLGLVAGALWAPATARAHLPNIASYQLAHDGVDWRLEVRMPTDGMHQVLKRRHPGVDLSHVSLEAYEGHLLEALEEGIEIDFDGRAVHLVPTTVNVAAHESSVDFRIESRESLPATIHVHIDALHEQGHQNNVLRLVGLGLNERKVLKAENHFEGEFRVPEAARTAFRRDPAAHPMGLAVGLLVDLYARLPETRRVPRAWIWWA